jgi:hypothetical protein
VSFQRYPYPEGGVLDALPRSCGALPILGPIPSGGVGGVGGVTVPCPAGEALWIGLVRTGLVRAGLERTGLVRTEVAGPTWRVAASVAVSEALVDVPPAVAVPGLPRGDGTWWALAREPRGAGAPACDVLELRAVPAGGAAASVRVVLVDAGEYRALGGAPLEPLDAGAAYGGWRLP